MSTRQEKFNRGYVRRNVNFRADISEHDIQHTPGLLNASIDDAIRYGGLAIRHALSGLPLIEDREHVIVDAKVHMLMPGMVPAIPGWHTDGVPRSENGAPTGPLAPDLTRQEGRRSPHYHLLVAGCDAPTVFLEDRNVLVDVPDHPTPDLYAEITREVTAWTDLERVEIPMGQWWTWDWWELHSAQPSRASGWRLLIRVTESDFVKPEADLRKVIRTHHQAYINGEFGW